MNDRTVSWSCGDGPERQLLSCEHEVLQRSGLIQPHGALIVVDAAGMLTHASSNVDALLGEALRCRIGQALPPPLAAHWRDLASTPGSRIVRAGCVDGRFGTLDLVASRAQDGVAVLEMIPHAAGQAAHEGGIPGAGLLMPALPPTPNDESGMLKAHATLVEEVARDTGFQRVMYYVFREDGDGEVVAEARHPGAYGSYLGLRFPGHDIPAIARQLYVKNPWRLIPDARAEPVPVVGLPTLGAPDLTWSDLRSVSPVHAAYLDNMAVRASLSFPVVVSGQLVALVAAHHREPTVLSVARCERAALRVRRHALMVTSWQAQRRLRLVDGAQRQFEQVERIAQRHGDIVSAWAELAPLLVEAFGAEGANLVTDGQHLGWGHGLEPDALAAVDEWFCDVRSSAGGALVWSSDSLSRQVPGFGLSRVAGAVALRIARPGEAGVRLYITRGETVHEVSWGGEPQKPEERSDGVLQIAPRRSFEKWIEKRLGYSRSWDNETRLLALQLREVLRAQIG